MLNILEKMFIHSIAKNIPADGADLLRRLAQNLDSLCFFRNSYPHYNYLYTFMKTNPYEKFLYCTLYFYTA